MNWKPRGEWELISADPTALRVTWRSERVLPLPQDEKLKPALRQSSLAWKEELPAVHPERRRGALLSHRE